MDRKIVLRVIVKSMNGDKGPNGLVPSCLVFGCGPRFPSVDYKLPDQQSRIDALSRARQEMGTIVSEFLLHRALAFRVPRNAELKIEPGKKVRIYCNTFKKYVGACPVVRIDGKQLFFVINYREVQFSFHQAIQASTYDMIVNGERLVHTISKVLLKFLLTRGSTTPNKKRIIPTVHITEGLHHTDLRTCTREGDKACELEIENLVRRSTWEMVVEEDVPKNANMITGFFVVTIKDVEPARPTFRA